MCFNSWMHRDESGRRAEGSNRSLWCPSVSHARPAVAHYSSQRMYTENMLRSVFINLQNSRCQKFNKFRMHFTTFDECQDTK